MKTLLLAGLMFLATSIAYSADPPPEVQAATKLVAEGNHQEAIDKLKTFVRGADTPPAHKAMALDELIKWMTQHDQSADAERLLEELAAVPDQDWRVLAAAGRMFGRLDASGRLEAGKFVRGHGGRGTWVSAHEYDQARALQLLLAARKKMPTDGDVADKSELLWNLADTWATRGMGGPGGAWALTQLTDVDTLPVINDDDDDDDQASPASGFPMEADGSPTVFRVPASFESARNDGERLRFALQEWAALSPAHAAAAKLSWASLTQGWFGVGAASGYLQLSETDLEKARRDSLSAVHTLSEDETVAMLATGPSRTTLPPEYRFLSQMREVMSSGADMSKIAAEEGFGFNAAKWRDHISDTIISELSARRQYPKAAAELRARLVTEKDLEALKSLTRRIEQIEGNWGRFESAKAQPAGKEATLPLVFRNATQVDCTARKVDVARLLKDMQEPANRRRSFWAIDYFRQTLVEEAREDYLAEEKITWSHKLEPAADHWDKRIDLPTPLKQGGAWLVEGVFNGGHPARILLWIDDLTLTVTDLANEQHSFVSDAVTGAPIEGAKIEFFGVREVTGIGGNRGDTETFIATTDKHGVAKIGESWLENYHWIMVVKAGDGRICFQHPNYWMDRYRDGARRGKRDSFYAITDRPVYRPGQEVKWQMMARRSGYDPKLDTNPFSGRKGSIVIHDPRGQKVVEKELRFDDWGTLGDALKLGDDAALGQYHAVWAIAFDHSHSFHFRVEEYKKPEFEVKVEAPDKPVALGEAFEFTVKADYYFGGPVKEAKVKYRVHRSVHRGAWYPVGRWDWLFGKGYGWQSQTYDWYPGAASWCIIMPPWYPWGHDPEETVLDGEARIGADGKLTVKVDTALAKELHGNQDHAYDVEVTVTDSSRRSIDGSGSIIAARRPFEVNAWLDRGYYRVGDNGTLQFAARTLDGKTVEASGKLRVWKVSYDESGKPNEAMAHEVEIATEDEAMPLHWPDAGQFRVEVKLKDKGGREAETSVFVVVKGEGFDGRGYRFDDLELLTDKEEYAPGDEVELLINTNREGSTVALFVYGPFADPVWLKLEGKCITHRFKLRDADQPNLNLYAYTVSDAQLHEAQRKLIIPPAKRIASVELITDKSAYLPRDKAKATVRVKDQNGQPFVGKLILTGYDKALEYISGGSNIADIREAFWGWTNTATVNAVGSMRLSEVLHPKPGEEMMMSLLAHDNVSTISGNVIPHRASRTMSAKSAMAPAAPVNADAAFDTVTAAPVVPPPGGGESTPVMIRSNLADSAVWITSITTNEAGEASLDFDMPDNLTTWKLRGWVLGKDAQVGEATVDVVTRKNLMVRLQAPRFFVEKDEVIISANVHNETDAPLVVQTALEIDNDLLTPANADTHQKAPITIAAHSEKRVDWLMRVIGPGEVKLTAKAISETESDAMQMTFPVYEHGMLKTDARSLALRSDQTSGKMSFTVPAERKPEASRLEVRWSPTLAMACIDALPYLTDYPYGCTEQTLNRFVPTVITLNILKDLGVDLKTIREKRTNLNAQEIGDAKERSARWQQRDHERKLREAVFDEDEVMKMARSGLNKLESMRNDDGGWGWFPGGRDSSAHITAVVVHGLKVARNAGLEMDEEVFSDGIEWLRQNEMEELARMKLDPKHRNYKAAPDNTDALVHCVLVEAGAGSDEMRGLLYEKRNDLSRLNVALLGIACHTKGEAERRDMCLRNLKQFLKLDAENQTAWLELQANSWWYWWGDEIETQAAFLKLLSLTEPKGDTASGLAKYLLNNRRNGTYWNSTRDTAAVIEALAAYAKASGETKPNMTVEVVLNGEVKKTVRITPDTLFSFDGSFVLDGDAVTSGEQTVELRKQGAGPLYANAYLTNYTKEDMIPAAGLEVKVERRYFKLTHEKAEANVSDAKGQAVKQTGTRTVRTELKSGDPLKSGDAVEVELVVESKNDYEYVLLADPKPAGFEPMEVQSGWSYDGLAAYKEYRDEKVAFFAERLPQGRHTLRYRVRAEVPGKFSALPAKAEAMYAPELRGNAAEWKAVISEAE